MSPFFGKIQRRLAVEARLGHPMPASGKRHRGAGVSVPSVPQSLPSARRWRLEPPGGARSHRSLPSLRPLLCLPGLPHPEADLKTQRLGANPSPEPTGGPRRRVLQPLGGGVALKPLLTHLLKKASRRLSPQRHLQGRDSPQGWTAASSAQGAPSLWPNFRQEVPSPWAHNDARTPAALGGQCQPPGCHQVPGLRPLVPPAVAGSGAERGLQLLGVPVAARAAPSPTARARRPPALLPAEAGGRRGVAAEGKQG